MVGNRKSIFNGRDLRSARGTKEYQAVIIDLVLFGILGKEDGEKILGYEIPVTCKLPFWLDKDKKEDARSQEESKTTKKSSKKEASETDGE